LKKLAPLLVGLVLASSSALAAYPDKPIRMIVPFAAGTTTDTIARAISDSLSKELGQPIIVENKAGAGGSIATDYVAKSKPDGYTLEFGTVGTFAINKGLFAKLPYDPSKDFTYLLMPGYTPTLLVVGRQAPYNNLADLINDARKRPGAVSFASAGNGTSGHLAGELLKNMSGVDMVHVPYKSGAQALTDTIGGQVGFLFYHPVAVVPHLKEGNLKALGASSKTRASLAPNIPTIDESGYQGFDLTAWFMLAAPAGLPKDVEDRLRAASAKVITEPSVKETLIKQGIEGTPITGAALNGFVDSEITKWADIIVKAKARID
jgi:tripartite-type tricarboxylate transporter receptor subunit TctC